MVRSIASKPLKVHKTSSSKAYAESVQSGVDILWEDDEEVTIKEEEDENPNETDEGFTEPELDDCINRTFVICDMPDVAMVQVKPAPEDPTAVLNFSIKDPLSNKRMVTVWGDAAHDVHEFAITNWVDKDMVFQFPDPNLYVNKKSKKFINTDASKFLQFVLRPAKASAASYHGVTEIYQLTTRQPNAMKDTFTLNEHVLPEIIEWPRIKYYTYKKKFLPHPSTWNIVAEAPTATVKHDFSKKSPVKAFKPRK